MDQTVASLYEKRLSFSDSASLSGPITVHVLEMTQMTTLTHWRPFRQIERWEPFGEIETLRQEMDKVFEQFMPGIRKGSNGFGFIPSAEMDETETEIRLKFEVPGMTADDLNIEVTDDAVTVRGERKSETKTEEDGVSRSEFQYGQFERVIPLASRVVKDQVAAEYKDGILSLVLPKSAEPSAESVKVKVAQ
ncbi:MAG: Hsp20/alpha crystallin family protein [Cyanobacteria bacterium J06627_15]